MIRLRDLQSRKVNIYLGYLADLLETTRLSKAAPRDEEDRLSLPFALAVLCGANQKCISDDFDYLIDQVPSQYVPMFITCWEVIEAEVDHDIVLWSEDVGTTRTVSKIRNLSKVIEHA
tara:strand:- start:174 stop:527 length:354 start_codon:yes stop_codon:yes gene_type:complete